MGYTGGASTNPTYHNLDGHTETVQIDFDPAVISYRELLDIFWHSHHPGSRPWSRQYQAAVFYHDTAQKNLALETRERVAAGMKGQVFTQVLPATEFYLAEDYHQKYFLRRVPELAGELTAIYPQVKDLVASTVAARLNGYLAGYGSRTQLESELGDLGLSPAGSKRLLALVSRSEPSGPTQGCPLPQGLSPD